MTAVERFWSRVRRGGDGECWEWQGALSTSQYGTISWAGKQRAAHRVSYEIAHGSVPRRAYICHHCDNRKCVNPAHLYAGDAKTNARDAVQRDRTGGRRWYASWGIERWGVIVRPGHRLLRRWLRKNKHVTVRGLALILGSTHGAARRLVTAHHMPREEVAKRIESACGIPAAAWAYVPGSDRKKKPFPMLDHMEAA